MFFEQIDMACLNLDIFSQLLFMLKFLLGFQISVVKADFLKAVRKAVSKRLIRLLYVVNRMNDCFKMSKTSVRLRTLNFF